MELPPYIDIHTHGAPAADGTVLAIQNCHTGFTSLLSRGFYSMGIHPWYLVPGPEALQQLTAAAPQPQVIAIGECGLDALRGPSLEAQAAVFEQQVLLANQLGKPLIIHCVRAFPQALKILEQARVPVIFHGFHKKETIARQVLDAGHYLSFGAGLQGMHAPGAAVLAAIPGGRFFLETDDKPVSIRDIYKIAASIRKTGEDEIILQLQKNFKTVFNV